MVVMSWTRLMWEWVCAYACVCVKGMSITSFSSESSDSINYSDYCEAQESKYTSTDDVINMLLWTDVKSAGAGVMAGFPLLLSLLCFPSWENLTKDSPFTVFSTSHTITRFHATSVLWSCDGKWADDMSGEQIQFPQVGHDMWNTVIVAGSKRFSFA